jgi:hypothetical protein
MTLPFRVELRRVERLTVRHLQASSPEPDALYPGKKRILPGIGSLIC